MMRRLASALGVASLLSVASLGARVPQSPQDPQVQPVVVGPNVNMAGGPTSFDPSTGLVALPLVGDPFLQRQNEPSLAVSSRNPCHLLAGANDYRAVDLEQQLLSSPETGDAWLGVFTSTNCGATWTSTLLAGHPVDGSAEGLASPIKGLAAAADPTVRAGTSGLFFMSGLAFNRGDNEIGKVFVSRFIDNNNTDGTSPIEYLGTTQIDTGTAGQFLDKPWIATDIPRGDLTCTVDGQTFPAGPAYLTYTKFVGGANNVHTQILFSKSVDCGATWSSPSKLSESFDKNQGTVIAVDPGTGAIYVVWREFTTPSDSNSRDAIVFVRSTDGGKQFTKAERIEPAGYRLSPFDQASSFATFRTNAYPTLAIVPAEAEGRLAGQPGRVYVAWAARGFVEPEYPNQGNLPDVAAGDARIVYSTSVDGLQGWSSPAAADPTGSGAGHQIMPALAFSGGKLALAYYDLREDRFGVSEDLVFEGGLSNYLLCRQLQDSGQLQGSVLACLQEAALTQSLKRHTIDLRGAMVDAACLASGGCSFASTSVLSTRVSRYASRASARLQHNRPNLPLFSKGRFPFIGDYIDLAGEQFVTDGQGRWVWNSGLTTGRPAPIFHVAWADNRDVRRPSDGDWEHYTARTAAVCDPGQAGIRNQNVYTAQLRPGLVVWAPINAKKISGFQRTFVVVVTNTTTEDRQYRFCLPGSACSTDPGTPGVAASFNQYTLDEAPITSLTLTIPRKSTASRTVFVQGGDGAPADAVVPVRVIDLGGGPAVPSAGFDTVYLNPDFDNPDFDNPDFDNVELHNPDFDNPDFDNPDFDNFSFLNPDFDNPDFDNLNLRNPDFDNPDFDNPDFDNPDFDNPDFDNPDFDNPDFDNPDFDNPDFDNATLADVTWKYSNPEGNTTSAYNARVRLNLPACTYVLQPGDVTGDEPDAVCDASGNKIDTSGFPASCQPVSCVAVQLVARRLYESPSYKLDSFQACVPNAKSIQNQALTNVYRYDPTTGSPSGDRNDATFYLQPGESGLVTLRLYGKVAPTFFQEFLGAPGAVRNVTLTVEPQAADCAVCTGEECGAGDGVGETTECMMRTPRIFDTIAPVLGRTGDIPGELEATGPLGAPNTLAAYFSASDDVDGDVPVTCGDPWIPLGQSEVTCSATDAAGNAALETVTVTVVDETAPTLSGTPFARTIEATSPLGATADWIDPTAFDAVDPSPTVTCDPLSGSAFPLGTTTVTCTATDASGNAASTTFTVAVLDTTKPTLTVPVAIVAEATGPAGASVSYAASATDIGDAHPALTCEPASGSMFPVGTTTVSCTATDASGNTAAAGFTINVVDTAAPTLSVIGDDPLLVEAGTSFADPGATASDTVAGDLTSAIVVSGTVNPGQVGSYTLTYAVSDGYNTTTATRVVSVVDTTAPVLGEASVNPATLWPPNGAIIPVTVTIAATENGSGVGTIRWDVVDEYGTYQPSGTVAVTGSGPFTVQVPLLADRKGNDKDGRHYRICITVTDRAGNASVLAQPLVVNVHDQSGE